jgi:hypothetical protein
MNGFYGLKRLTGNIPAVAPLTSSEIIDHPTSSAAGKPILMDAVDSI